jgi:glycosyltransferase involved in cell wall biosynthesis
LRDSPWVDGPGRTILETAARIDRSRVEYTIAPLVSDDAAKHPLVLAARNRGLRAVPVLDTGAIAPLVERVAELVDRLDIEILHSSEFRTNLVALGCRRRRPELRIVSTAHGWIANDLHGKAKSFIDRILLRHFNLVVPVSHAVRRRLPRWWVPDSRVRVIHNALMLDSYGRAYVGAGRHFTHHEGPVRLLAAARLSAEKGLDLLLQAFASLSREFPRLRLKIAGTGPQEPDLRRLTVRLGLMERVEYLGHVTDMCKLYAETDLVVQSSLTEGLPNVMLEAAYLGVPVVATDAGGTDEVVEHGYNGWLVRAGSADALAAGIRRYLEDPAAFVEMAARGRRRVEERFSIDVRTVKQAEIYEALVDRMA